MSQNDVDQFIIKISEMKRVMIKISKGDKQSYELLFNEFYSSLCVFAERYVTSEDLAKDIVQDVFCKIWEKKSDCYNIRDAKSYLYMGVKNACINELRIKKKKVPDVNLMEIDVEVYYKEQFIAEETYRLLRKAIDNLPEQTRKIMCMAVDGLKNPVIASELGVSKHTVHTLKKRAYRYLREHLKDAIVCWIHIF